MIKQLSKFLWGVVMVFAIPLFSMAQGQDKTTQVTFSNQDFVDRNENRITTTSGYSTTGTVSGYYKFQWAANSNLRFSDGDYFTFQIPKIFDVTPITRNLNIDGINVAKLQISSTGLATITFNANAKFLTNFRGNVLAPVKLSNLNPGDNTISFDGITFAITYHEQKYTPPTTPTQPSTDSYANRTISKTSTLVTESNASFYRLQNYDFSNGGLFNFDVRVNRLHEDFGDKEIIIVDQAFNADTNKQSIFSIPDSSVIPFYKVTDIYQAGDFRGAANFTIQKVYPSGKQPQGRKSPISYMGVTTDEEEYHNAHKNGNYDIAFLKINDDRKGFSLFVKNIGQAYIDLHYYLQEPADNLYIRNRATWYADNERVPTDRKNSTIDFETSSVQASKGFGDIYADKIGQLVIRAYDANNTTRFLEGAIFTLRNKTTGQEITAGPTDTKGEFITEVLDNGEYTLTETTAPNGYQLVDPISIIIDRFNRYEVSIVNVPHTVKQNDTHTYTAEIVWVGGSEPRPDVTLMLERDGRTYLSAEIKTLRSGTTSVSWTNLPKKHPNSNIDYTYTVRQLPIKGYTMEDITHTENKKTTITNKFQTTRHTTTIVWEGGSAPRPTITLILKQDGEQYTSQRIFSGRTSHTWDNLPIFNGNDGFANYTVEVASIDKYTVKNITYGENSSQITIAPAICTKPAITTGTALETIVGISDIRTNTDEWPHSRKGGWIALESNNKGFVINRLSTAQIRNITHPQEGMIAYDTTEKCLKIFNGAEWKCFSNPVCPQFK